MKTNVQVKDEPVELQVNELLRLYGYNISQPSTSKPTRTKAISNQEQEPSTCAWCQKLGIRSFTLRTDNGEVKSLCSEVCFNQYRRASFKKNKGSDWDVDHHALSTITTNKNKSVEKKNGSQQCDYSSVDINRRKILLPIRRSTPTVCKTKPTAIPRKISPPRSSKRQRSSSPSSSNEKTLHLDQTPLLAPPPPPPNLPVSLAWQPSLFLPSSNPWAPPMDINRFQYPFFAPPPPPPPAPVLPSTSSSTLFSTLTKGVLSNYTCILPTFIPLPIPIPIPLCFPISLPCGKCSVEVNDQQCQTITDDDHHPKRTRRISV